MIFGRSGNKKNQQTAGAAQAAPANGQPAGFAPIPGAQAGGYNGGYTQGSGMPGTYFPQAQGNGYPQPGAGGAAYMGSAGYPQAGNTGTNGNMPYSPSGTGYAGYTPAGNSTWTGAQPYAGANSYAAPAAGYSQSAGYAQNGYVQGYAQPAGSPMQGGYAPQGGYAQGTQAAGGNPAQGGYAQGYQTAGGNPVQGQYSQGYAQQPAGNTAWQPGPGYMQPSSYSPGYAANGYQRQEPRRGFGGFAQMGRNRQNGFTQMGTGQQGQIPLNGGGYVPPSVQVNKAPFHLDDLGLILIGAALLAMFIVGFVTRLNLLLWIFAVLAVAMTAFFWVRPVIATNKRLCFTVVFVLLALVAVLSAAGVLQPVSQGGNNPAGTAETQSPSGNSVSGGGVVVDPKTGQAVATVDATEPTATPTAAMEDNSAVERLESFFYYWTVNKKDEMLTLCSPVWAGSVDNPKAALFGLIANRTPLDYAVERISGTQDDKSRTASVVSTLDRNNGKEPVKYRLSVLMVRGDDNQWYVDPQSLKTYETAETQDPATIATPTPTATPPTPASTVLYYNPDGGTKYHLDQNCKSTHAKYLPLKGHFKFSEINDKKYKDLEPCNVCAAPLRPDN